MRKSSIQPANVMAVVNITSDSFSGDGILDALHTDVNKILLQRVAEGAGVLDIGAAASNPGAHQISVEEELRRLRPIFTSIQALELDKKVRLSIDTFQPQVANAAIASGFSIVNDISALRYSEELGGVIAASGVDVILMFSKKGDTFPIADTNQYEYDNVIDTISSFFNDRIEFAQKLGIQTDKILLDPGMGGFISPNPDYSWEIIQNLDILQDRFPDNRFVYGVSRKRFFNADAKKREYLSKIVELSLLRRGVNMVRTHNVSMLYDIEKLSQELAE